MKFSLLSILGITTIPVFSQNIGIGTSTPQYKLDVSGELRTSSNAYFGNFVGIGTTSPSYKLQVNDGSIAIYNTTDVKTWYLNYSSTNNYFQFAESGTARMVIANGGNVGINTTTPSQRLDVSGNAAISGSLTVNSGKGVLYNLSNSANVKYYTRSAAFNITNLGAHSLSAEGSIGFIGGFTAPPAVYVGNIVTTGGTAGPLYQLELVIYDVTATGCKCRLRNVSNFTITQNCTWNIVCIGY
ncbi:MAG: hypothetical protein V4717_24015 [Bacteroidota bacterium]